MTRRTDHLPMLPPIDDEPGPMPQLSAAEADALAWAAVSRWAAQPPGLEPADDALGPSQPLSADAAERLVQSALRQHARGRRARPALAAWAQRAAAVALCLFAAVGVSFAAYRLWPTWNPAAHGGTVAAASGMPRARQAERPGSEASTTSDSEQRAAASDIEPPTVADKAPAAVSSKARSESADAKPSTSVDFDALLARANSLRAKRRWVSAEASYRQVLAADASTAQRYVALVAAAALALEHLGKPARALALYEGALALMPQGNLDEEARFGIAASQRALGNSLAEQRALERLTAQHPSGLYSAAAKRRLLELEADQKRGL